MRVTCDRIAMHRNSSANVRSCRDEVRCEWPSVWILVVVVLSAGQLMSWIWGGCPGASPRQLPSQAPVVEAIFAIESARAYACPVTPFRR